VITGAALILSAPLKRGDVDATALRVTAGCYAGWVAMRSESSVIPPMVVSSFSIAGLPLGVIRALRYPREAYSPTGFFNES
jgi:hypothetical protein